MWTFGDFKLQEIHDTNYLDKVLHEVSMAKGKELINFKKKQKENSLNTYILTFKMLDGHKTPRLHEITIIAKGLKCLKHDKELGDVFYNSNPDKIFGKKLIEYENWQTEKLVDTGNLSGPKPNLTLIFEDGYSIEIERISP